MKNLTFYLCIFLFVTSCKDEAPVMPTNTLPVVSIDELSVTEGNSDNSIFASVRLSKEALGTVTIFVESADGTAQANVDYLPVSTSVEFAPGSIQENIKLDILGDDMSETDEYFKLNIINVSGAVIGTESVSVIIENDDLGDGNVVIPSTGFSTSETYPNMELIWSDEFSGTQLDETFWTYETGNGSWGWGNNELEFYREDNTSIVDGHLVIEARDEFYNGFDYTSSRLITKGKFDFKFGRVDIRAVIPEGQGIWPALWMLGANISSVGWPSCGEIDIMELVGHQPYTTHATVHYANNNGDHMPPNGSSVNLSGGAKYSDEFHVFSLEWEENSIKIYMDNQLVHTATPASLGTQNPYPFNEPFFFIFNVAVGGTWPGSPNASTVFPQHMIVDYIRVFQPE